MSQIRPFDRTYCTHESENKAMIPIFKEPGTNV